MNKPLLLAVALTLAPAMAVRAQDDEAAIQKAALEKLYTLDNLATATDQHVRSTLIGEWRQFEAGIAQRTGRVAIGGGSMSNMPMNAAAPVGIKEIIDAAREFLNRKVDADLSRLRSAQSTAADAAEKAKSLVKCNPEGKFVGAPSVDVVSLATDLESVVRSLGMAGMEIYNIQQALENDLRPVVRGESLRLNSLSNAAMEFRDIPKKIYRDLKFIQEVGDPYCQMGRCDVIQKMECKPKD